MFFKESRELHIEGPDILNGFENQETEEMH